MDRRIGERQRWAWLLAALSAVTAACVCGISWPWVLAGGVVTAAYYIYMDVKLPPVGLAAMLPGVLRAAGLLWTVFVLAWSANLADQAFPMIDGYPLLGWTVLALAAWGSWKGVGACARCAGVLCLFLAVLYAIVAAFALPDVQGENLLPTPAWKDSFRVLGLFLLPAAVWYAPCTRSKKRPAWEMALLIPLGAALLAAVTAGVLSPVLASTHPAPLYTLAQSVSLFGVVERIEPLLSAAMVMGVFCLLSAMSCAAVHLAGKRWAGIAVCAASGLLMGPAGKADALIATVGNLIFFVVIPLAVVALRNSGSVSPRNGGGGG